MRKYSIYLLVIVTAVVWIAVLTYPNNNFRIIACDVGQGDAILAVQGKTQILIDGGPDNSVLDCLSHYMPFWDRNIEGVILTHPQKDHYGGLIDVFKRYDVEIFMANALDSGASEYRVLKDVVGGRGIRVVNLEGGMEVRLGLIHLDILWPSEEFLSQNSQEDLKIPNVSIQHTRGVNQLDTSGVLGSFTSKLDPNEFSVVAILSFKDFDALLTGDMSPEISDEIAEQLVVSPSTSLRINSSRTIDYLKVPHHGSKNGLTQELLDASNPEVAIISVGKNNSYGHPHKEVSDMLASFKLRVFRTDKEGDIVIESDGNKLFIKE
ncbi:MAG: hypothetical protein US60_C0013G0014 [Microgenomates group bacterium GW2011_GWC1_37_8]|uniref:Metallo-beta-lactamase domain-containing protein n=1 Tax=Candidatus Woesebacteria bacterium GW2011_GWB1_38_8 TaxID=1618570 RepID=A0A0G0L8Y7_9BACT|nr:MAG: hypothetical protein US60_C0013G0014 [Microgenomates group bacterium GW2011_GWC1_37_8]KKQ84325.1 MAG: hypothetical protein UT08_C0019G0019 [Candidatus Woesebacteria bacterium GW2011_GWB1_38_8]